VTVEERWTGLTSELFVRVAIPEAPRAAVLLLHGYSEHSERYLHAIDLLVAAGFAVVAPDHQGHGRTGKTLGLIPRGSEMVADVLAVRRQLAQRVPGVPIFVVGASMGGLLALRAIQREPAAFAGAVLQAPAVAMPADVGPALLGVVRFLGAVWPSLPVRPFFKPERATRDLAFQAWMRTDPYTYRGWVKAGTARRSMQLIKEVRAELSKVRCPVLITHGAEDLRVLPSVTESLASQLGGPVERHVFPNLRHEAHQEPERDEVVGSWVDWLVRHSEVG
jgi:alpha-beta hydrolase superfamily lysophospholipase